jgi:hypothetical protein
MNLSFSRKVGLVGSYSIERNAGSPSFDRFSACLAIALRSPLAGFAAALRKSFHGLRRVIARVRWLGPPLSRSSHPSVQAPRVDSASPSAAKGALIGWRTHLVGVDCAKYSRTLAKSWRGLMGLEM